MENGNWKLKIANPCLVGWGHGGCSDADACGTSQKGASVARLEFFEKSVFLSGFCVIDFLDFL